MFDARPLFWVEAGQIGRLFAGAGAGRNAAGARHMGAVIGTFKAERVGQRQRPQRSSGYESASASNVGFYRLNVDHLMVT
jgi:hypothetical protein